MNRLLLLALAGSLAQLAPAVSAKTITLTNAQNGKAVTLAAKAVTLAAGDTLVVRLTANTGLGATEWHVVYNPNMLLQLSGVSRSSFTPHPHSIVVVGWGDPIIQEFRFTVPQLKGGFVKGAWLRFLSLSSFEPDVKGAKLWRIQYTVKAAK